MNLSDNSLSRISIALGILALGAAIWGVFKTGQTQNPVYLAVPLPLLLLTVLVPLLRNRNQKQD